MGQRQEVHRTRRAPAPPITIQRKTALIVLGIVGGAGLLLGSAVGAAGGTDSTATPRRVTKTVTKTVTATPKPAKTQAPAAAVPRTVKLPNLVGKNGAIAMDTLRRLGVTNLQLASGDPLATTVLLPQNWRITKQEPRGGTKAKTGADGTLVVLTAVKR